MPRNKLKIIITESFIPYLFLIITLLIALLVIDRKIEKSDDVLLVDLSRNEEAENSEDQITISQTFSIDKLSPASKKILDEINGEIASQNWKTALKKIHGAPPEIKENQESRLSEAYLYYKTGKLKTGIKLLRNIAPQDNARYYYNLGLLLAKQKKTYPEAITNFQKFLQIKKDSYEAYMNIGHLYNKSDKTEKAVEYFEKAAAISNLTRKAKAYYWLAYAKQKANDLKEALKYYEKTLHHNPEYVNARIHRAEIEFELFPDKSAKVAEDLIKLAQAYPDKVQVYLLLGDYYEKKGESHKVVYWYKKGLLQFPNSTPLRSALAMHYYKSAEYDDAQSKFLELSEQFPNDPHYLFYLASSSYNKGEYEDAIEVYQKLLLIKPNDYQILQNLGVAYSKNSDEQEKNKALGAAQSDRAKAIYYYTKANAIKHDSSTVYFNLGILYSKNNQNTAALQSYQKALELKKDYPEALFNMGFIYNRLQDYAHAQQSYSEAIKIRDNYTNAYINLSEVYEKQGHLKKAIDLLKKGMEKSSEVKLKNKLAELLTHDKNFEEAVKMYLEVLEKEPDNTDSLRDISELYFQLNNFSESEKYIEQYINLNPKDPEPRYLLMVCKFNLKDYRFAYNEWEILDRIAPDYKDMQSYKDKILEKLK